MPFSVEQQLGSRESTFRFSKSLQRRSTRRSVPQPGRSTHQRPTIVTVQLEPEGLRIPKPPKSPHLAPSYWLSREDTVEAQLKALQQNNFPSIDHGIEVMYRFAGFDPWQRSTYFGRSLDLGQFERFRRIFYTQPFVTLLQHTECSTLSTLEVDEDVWKARVYVKNGYRKDEGVWEFTLNRRQGGRYDGYWYTTSLIRDGFEDKDIYGVI